ncbi:MAG: hypothetical protein KC423_00895 [Anaerolineales bacterium]|nr:hypothetical protein [Anaerolineales bacterium]
MLGENGRFPPPYPFLMLDNEKPVATIFSLVYTMNQIIAIDKFSFI